MAPESNKFFQTLIYSEKMNRDRSRSPSRGQNGGGKPYGKERFKEFGLTLEGGKICKISK